MSTDSPLLREAFVFYPNFHKKYKYMFGPLLEVLSLYMMYSSVNELGIDWIATSQENLAIIIKMGRDSLKPPEQTEDPYLQYQQEGAVLF